MITRALVYLITLKIRDLILTSRLEPKSSPRPISTHQLSGSPHLHLGPINLVVSQGPYSSLTEDGRSYLGVGFTLRCFQRLSRRDIATRRLLLAEQPVHQRSPHPGPLVLGVNLLKSPAPAAD